MAQANPEWRSRVKAKLLQLLTAGAGSIVVATTVIPTPAGGNVKPPSDAVMERAAQARAKLTRAAAADHAQPAPIEIAWWRNWGNGGWHPRWNNWPNWRNWRNWRNW